MDDKYLDLNGPNQSKLLQLGLLVMLVSPERDQNMTTLVRNLLQNPENSTTVVQRVQARHPVPQNTLLQQLSVLLERLDFQDHEVCSLYTRVIPYAWVTVGGIFVALRLFAKIHISGRLNRGDWLILFSWILTLLDVLIVCMTRMYGKSCHHIWDITQNEFKLVIHLSFIHEVVYVLIILLLKITAIVIFWDLVPRGNTRYRFYHRSIIAVFIYVAIVMILGLCSVIFQCKPVSYWNNYLDAQCYPHRALLWGICAILVSIGIFLILLLPIRVVWDLELVRREKIIVSFLFLLGSLPIFASIPRYITTEQLLRKVDFSWYASSTTQWLEMEFQTALMALCIPSLKSLTMRCWPRLLGYTRSKVAGINKSLVPSAERGSSESGSRVLNTENDENDEEKGIVVREIPRRHKSPVR